MPNAAGTGCTASGDGVWFTRVAALGADGEAGRIGISESSVLGEDTNVRLLWWKERLTALESGL